MIEYFENYITPEVELELLKQIQSLPRQPRKQGKNRNQIWRFGNNRPYPSSMISHSVPEWLKIFPNVTYDHVTINEYLPGQIIPYHVDNEASGSLINIVSLRSSATMKLKHPLSKSTTIKSIDLHPRSLLILSGEERWKLQHGVDGITDTRYSIVLRDCRSGYKTIELLS